MLKKIIREAEDMLNEEFDSVAPYSVGFTDNYRGANSQCVHDLTSDNRKTKKHLKQFLSYWITKAHMEGYKTGRLKCIEQHHKDELDYAIQQERSRLLEEIEKEIEIQELVQKKAKEVVAVGRKKVSEMLKDKHIRQGKIEALEDIKQIIIK